MAHSILVVDDEEKIVDVLKSYLENEGYTVVSAKDGIQALKQFERYSPDLVVLDLMMPGMSGEDVCKAIRKRSRVPIIMVTAKVEEKSIVEGFKIGADDYITKPFSPRQLIVRVEAVLRRVSTEAIPVASEISINNGELVIDSYRREVRKNGEHVALTPKEFKILMTMVKYPTKAFTREELISFALSDEFEGFDRVIDTHIKNIRQKIEDDAKVPRYIITIHGVGYKFGGDGHET